MENEIIEYPAPALSRIASPVGHEEFGTDELRKLVKRMSDLVYRHEANGLAAPQINVDKALVLYKEKDGMLHALCNPKIIARSGKVKSYDEGCLSSPGFRLDVRRSKIVKVQAYTVEGEEIEKVVKGFPAIILQHEIDHINGHTLIGMAPSHNQDKREYIRRVEHVENTTKE